MTLQRLVLDYRTGELVLRVLYRRQDGPNPGTKAREQLELIERLEALEEALEQKGGRRYGA